LNPTSQQLTHGTIIREQSLEKHRQSHKRIDSYGIPLIGTDDKPIKLLRCGHIFDMTIWQMWVDSGQGNVLIYVQFVVKMWVRRNENLHLILERTPPDKEEVL